MGMSEDFQRFRLIEGGKTREFTDCDEFKALLAEMMVKNHQIEFRVWEEVSGELVVEVL
jgi:hypothetical protein